MNAPLGVPDLRDPGELVPGGRKVTLRRAESSVNFHGYRPDDSAASDNSIQEVWVSGGGDSGTVGLRYGSKLRLFLTAWPEGKSFGGWARGIVSDTGSGFVDTVRGVDAWIVPPDANWDGSPGSVELVLDGIDITLIEDGQLTRDDLLRIVDTLS